MSDSSGKKIQTQNVQFTSTEVSEIDRFTVFNTNSIPQVTKVRLYEDTIQKVISGHGDQFPAESPSVIDAVGQTINNPTHVEKSYNNSYVYVESESTNASGDPFRVPVKIVEKTSARVKTYFFASTEDDVEVVYRRSNE